MVFLYFLFFRLQQSFFLCDQTGPRSDMRTGGSKTEKSGAHEDTENDTMNAFSASCLAGICTFGDSNFKRNKATL